MAWHTGVDTSAAMPMLWSLACLVVGLFLGFLFGIPKVLQSGALTSTAAPDGPGSVGGAQPGRTYQQLVNTNLTEISDWLTKIIVGLGLINLGNIPGLLNDLASTIASGMQDPADQEAFALSLIVFFSIVGFLYGYLSTRLFLARALGTADAESTRQRDLLQKEITQEARRQNVGGPAEPPSLEEMEKSEEGAERVEAVAARLDISVVRAEARGLADEYEQTRASMRPGNDRTRRMEVVFSKMKTLGFAVLPILADLKSSRSPGERLLGIASLQVRPDPSSLDWLASRISEERPFVGYHAAVALLTAVRRLDTSHCPALRRALEMARAASAPADSDRDKILSISYEELSTKCPPLE